MDTLDVFVATAIMIFMVNSWSLFEFAQPRAHAYRIGASG